ncbi:putative zn(2)-C6 fungal-type DNA-binding domain-containing protein [Septoria linicola]|nr:putative zn(2)-C6 fungal-type DNA-binding domain-containing protein [Septoria linicola]
MSATDYYTLESDHYTFPMYHTSPAPYGCETSMTNSLYSGHIETAYHTPRFMPTPIDYSIFGVDAQHSAVASTGLTSSMGDVSADSTMLLGTQNSAARKVTPALPAVPRQLPPRLKVYRTPKACEECRDRKQKCNGQARCEFCKQRELACRYRKARPTTRELWLAKLINLAESARSRWTLSIDASTV